MQILKKNKEQMGKIGFAAFIDFAFAFSVFVFIPYEVYLGNVVEFNFRLNEFWMPVVIGIVLFTCIFIIHIFLKGFLYDLYTSLVFGGTLACYVQSMFLNGMMKRLDGTEIAWDKSNTIINLCIWIGIVLVPCLICKFKRELWKMLCEVGTLVIVGAQAIALVSLLVTAQVPTIETKISDKGIYEVSKSNNVIIFCLDKFDQKFIDRMLELYPDALDEMKGFTYYPNATGKYCYTHIAIPYLLSGNIIPEYNPTDEQYCKQLETSNYFDCIAKNAGNVGIYTNEYCVRSSVARSKIDNCISLEYSLEQKTIAKACIKSSLYRVMPFAFKGRFEYSSENFNKAVNVYGDVQGYNPDTHETDAKMLDVLENTGLTINEKYGKSAFRFIHLKGTHDIYELNDNGDYTGEVTSVEQCAAGDFKVVSKYCEELERLGLFEEATIIVVADHGLGYVLKEDSDEYRNVNPIFFYKPAGVTRTEALKTSLAPVAHDDIFATVMNSFGEDGSQYGYTIDEIHEDMERVRYFYWCYQDPEITDRESCIHIEYEIKGDSRDNANWKETGKYIYPNNNPRHKDIVEE